MLRCLSECFFVYEYTASRFWKSCAYCLTKRSEEVLTQHKIESRAAPVEQSHEQSISTSNSTIIPT